MENQICSQCRLGKVSGGRCSWCGASHLGATSPARSSSIGPNQAGSFSLDLLTSSQSLSSQRRIVHG